MQTDHAAIYANALLSDMGDSRRVDELADHPAIAFRRTGLLQITGKMLPVPLVSHADGALLALKTLSPDTKNFPKTGSELLGERARINQFKRRGRISAGGKCRLLETADGRIALNLVRQEDWNLIPAWLEDDAVGWGEIEFQVSNRQRISLIQRASEIGLAAAIDSLPPKPKTWFQSQCFQQAKIKDPLVVDLSSLWAGPLASSLLGMAGAQVIKVESPVRPDGMRSGNKEFYRLINAGKDCVSLDFRNDEDLNRLRALLHKADVVIEASRPRAMRQLGIFAEDFVSQKPGKIWARLTAYDRSDGRIGFGDDIGVSAGLTSIMEIAHENPCFVGDAIADPIAGLHVALAIQHSLNQGGGTILDFSMCEVLRYAIGDVPKDVREKAQEWEAIARRDDGSFYLMRDPLGDVKNIGADNAVWL